MSMTLLAVGMLLTIAPEMAQGEVLEAGSCSAKRRISTDAKDACLLQRGTQFTVDLMDAQEQGQLSQGLSVDQRRESHNDSLAHAVKSASITVVSYNLYWWNVQSTNRWKQLYDTIKQNSPFDLIGFQECEDVGLVLRSTGLNNFDYYQGPNKPASNPAPLAWNRDIFSNVGGPGNKWVASDQYGGRYMTWVRLNHVASGVNIFFANTHGPLGNCGSTLGSNWAAGISENKVPGDIVFFTGDFNCGTGSSAMNAVKGALVNDGVNDIDGGIDQIITDLGLKESGGSINGWPSDHPMIKGMFRVGSAAPATPTPAPMPTCYDALAALASDEGTEVGFLPTSSLATCKDSCAANSQCNSLSFCPQWGGCWFKSRSFEGDEAVVSRGECRTYYKKACDGDKAPIPTPTPAPSSSESDITDTPTPNPTPSSTESEITDTPTQNPAHNSDTSAGDEYQWVGAPLVGGWGGRCKCPSGNIYEVGDNYDSCGSLACVGGEVVEKCGNNVISTQRAGWAVTCACNLDADAGGYSCGARIKWLTSQAGGSKSDAAARTAVAQEFPSACGACQKPSASAPAPGPVPASTGNGGSEGCLTFVSYNIQYNNAQGLTGPGNVIKQLNADVVGTQETQDKHGLATASGRTLVGGTDFQNPMYYDPSKLSVTSSGWEKIPRDNYADRTYVWATFSVGGRSVSVFNTHLPHKHGEAGSLDAHKLVAEQIAEQAQSMSGCKVIMGDMNPHAGNFKGEISSMGFTLAAQSTTQLGGYDQLFVSSECGAVTGTGDGPNGGSDHVPVHACIKI